MSLDKLRGLNLAGNKPTPPDEPQQQTENPERDIVIGVRFSKAEREKIKALAIPKGLTASAYCRMLILESINK